MKERVIEKSGLVDSLNLQISSGTNLPPIKFKNRV